MVTKIVLFGITGDLSKRKLIPALETVISSNTVSNISKIIGVSRRSFDVNEILNNSQVKDQSVIKNLLEPYVMDLNKLEDYFTLKDYLDIKEGEQVLFYLSVPAGSAMIIADLIGQSGMNSDNCKILCEKPFGTDLVSAVNFLESMSKFFKEEQIYRIDHYLSKPNAEELINLNKVDMESGLISKIKIIGAEKIGIEGRGSFYEQTGNLKDFVQNHLMVLLALSLANNDDPETRASVLGHISVGNVRENAKRGQYKTYREEVNNQESKTETFTSLKLYSDKYFLNETKILLISGKSCSYKKTSVLFKFKDGKEIEIDINKNSPKIIDGKEYIFDAYEYVFINAIAGNRSRFISANEIINSWKIVQPVLDYWKASDEILIYENNSDISEIIK